jgi:hypothetical protein
MNFGFHSNSSAPGASTRVAIDDGFARSIPHETSQNKRHCLDLVGAGEAGSSPKGHPGFATTDAPAYLELI